MIRTFLSDQRGRTTLSRPHGVAALTAAGVVLLSASLALLSPELSAQKGSPNSIRTVYRAKECPEDYITALPGLALGEIVYGGKHWFSDWIRLSPDGSTSATYESSEGST
jgi:hypothetical protein